MPCLACTTCPGGASLLGPPPLLLLQPQPVLGAQKGGYLLLLRGCVFLAWLGCAFGSLLLLPPALFLVSIPLCSILCLYAGEVFFDLLFLQRREDVTWR